MNQTSVQQRLEIGLAHHRAGRLREAEAIYRQILAEKPDFTDALHLLGSLGRKSASMTRPSSSLKEQFSLIPTSPLTMETSARFT